MAYRYYLTNSTAPYSPATLGRGTWSRTTGAVTKLLGSAPGGTATTVQGTKAATTNPYNTLVGRWVSVPLLAGTLSGVVSWVIGAVENTTSANAVFRIHIFVTAGDSDTVRGTVLTNFTGTLASQEFPTTASGQSALDQNLTSLAVQAGDRLVVEVGVQFQNTSTTSTATFNYGNTGVIDLRSADTAVTTRPGWVQFSDPGQVINALSVNPKNMCDNPSAGSGATDGWANGTAGSNLAAGSVSGMSRSTGVNFTVVSASVSCAPPKQPAAVGEQWAVYVQYSCTNSRAGTIYFNFQDAAGSFLTPNPSFATTLTPTAQAVVFALQTAPANTATVSVTVEGTAFVAGDVISVSCVRYDLATISDYADGDSASWVWDGTAELSTSHQLPIPPPRGGIVSRVPVARAAFR